MKFPNTIYRKLNSNGLSENITENCLFLKSTITMKRPKYINFLKVFFLAKVGSSERIKEVENSANFSPNNSIYTRLENIANTSNHLVGYAEKELSVSTNTNYSTFLIELIVAFNFYVAALTAFNGLNAYVS